MLYFETPAIGASYLPLIMRRLLLITESTTSCVFTIAQTVLSGKERRALAYVIDNNLAKEMNPTENDVKDFGGQGCVVP